MDREHRESFGAMEPDGFYDRVHLSDYIRIVKRRKWAFLFVFVFIVGVVSLFTVRATPMYQAATQVLIGSAFHPMNMAEVQPISPEERDYHLTQYNLLMSRTLAYRVIRELSLWDDAPVEQSPPPAPSGEPSGPWARLAGRIPVLSGVLGLDSPGDAPHSSVSASVTPLPDPALQPLLDPTAGAGESPIPPYLVDRYLSRLSITPVRGSRLVQVGFLSPSPEEAARVADAHARMFIEQSTEWLHSAAQKPLLWLEEQVHTQRAKLEASRKSLYAYQKIQDLGSMEDRENIVSQKLMELNSSLTRAKGERIAQETAYRQLAAFSAGGNADALLTLPEIAQDPVIQRLRGRLLELKAELREKTAKYEFRHPKLIEIQSQVEELEVELTGEIQRLRETVKSRLDRAVALERAIQDALDAQRALALSINERAIEYATLKLEAETNQQIYDILLKQFNELHLTSAVETSNILVVDSAETPLFPVKPKPFLNVSVAVVLGFFLGTGFAFFREYMDNTVKSREDVTRRLRTPLLGMIPYNRALKRAHRPALPSESSDGKTDKRLPAAQGYGYELSTYLQNNLAFRPRGGRGEIYLVESAVMGEGKTTVASHLAAGLSKVGLSTLLVDCDFERPALHRLLGVENQSGLCDAMSHVYSQDIRSGSLETFSVDDLFFFMALQKRSGRLHVTNGSDTITASFRKGNLLHIESDATPPANRLGSILLRGGFITESRLQEALDTNQRTGLPIGYILVNLGYLSQNQLKGPLRLQAEEHLHKLYSWKRGRFSFEDAAVEPFGTHRIFVGEDYTDILNDLSRLSEHRFLHDTLFAHIQSAGEGPVYVLPAGTGHRNLNGASNPILLARILDHLKRHFDAVLLDGPPILDSAGGVFLSSLADGIILVVRSGQVSFKTVNEALSRLGEARTKVLGAVLNQVKPDVYRYDG